MGYLMPNYNPKEAEQKWLKYWEKHHIHAFDSRAKKKKTFTIDTPPPTVSGEMHIGHAFSYAQQDFIARYKRMQGFNVFYPFGTDDNGLPTERLVEKMKNVKGITMSRPEFVKLCYQTIKETKKNFVQPWKDLGMSCDFSKSYSTIDNISQRTSQAAFIELYHQGAVYQQDAPVMWCVECQTAIAQAELKDQEKDSTFNDIAFSIGKESLIIATTRPELIPACVALLAHPDDKRYKKYIGKHATVPLFNYEVPIIADVKADPAKGTGLLMVCTFGDKSDVEWWHQYKLPLRSVLNKDGALNDIAGKYATLTIKHARKAILEDLKAAGLLKSQKNIRHVANVHERCDTPIEFLKTRQWFTRILDKKEEWIEAGNRIAWYPEFMKKRYEHWVENLQWDWCISRQRFFGVPFPLWYCKQCNSIILADVKDLPVDPLKDRPKKKCDCGSAEFEPEKDVMDTWATSSVSPQIAFTTYGISEQVPMDLRPQASDILSTWCFYTIVKSMYLAKKIPWKNIILSGYIMDPQGEKMSKSKGNVVEPVAIMERYSADALRFWAAGSKLGEDISYQEKDIVTGQKTITKLWNAANLVLANLQGYNGIAPDHVEVIDRWLLQKLDRLIANCTKHFDNYEHAKAKFETEQFFWTIFCDNYLEIAKDRLYNKERNKESKISAQYAMHLCLKTLLKLFAPIMPYITEEIYQSHFKKDEQADSIHLSAWPAAYRFTYEFEEKIGDELVQILQEARKYKAQNHLNLKAPVKITIEKDKQERLAELLQDLKAVTCAEITFGTKFNITH